MHVDTDGDIIVYKAAFAAQRTCYRYHLSNGGLIDFGNKRKTECKAQLEAQNIEIEDKSWEPYIMKTNQLAATMAARQIMLTILGNIGNVTSYNVYLTSNDKSNYRFNLATIKGYKANRKPESKPIYYDAVREYLETRWDSTIVYGKEADDALVTAHYKEWLRVTKDKTLRPAIVHMNSIIATIDKDIDTCPGLRYNINRKMKYYVTMSTAWRNFYKQIITGDNVDNIPGLKTWMPLRAVKLAVVDNMLNRCNSERELFDAVHSYYKVNIDEEYDKDLFLKRITEIGQLLWIQREEDVIWSPPYVP